MVSRRHRFVFQSRYFHYNNKIVILLFNENQIIIFLKFIIKALSLWGTDFEIISKKTFCGRKTRDQIKNKYKRERKNNLTKVNTALDTRIIG